MKIHKTARVALLALAFVACGQNTSPSLALNDNGADALSAAKKRKTISISPKSVTLATGASEQFTAKASSGTVVWSASLGSIDDTGLYVAPGKAGQATITAKISGTSIAASATVTITAGGTPGGPGCFGNGASLEAACASASEWGSGLSATFGRIDGTLTAIAKPTDSQCNQSNSTHLVIEVTMNGKPYPLVVNVKDSQSSTGEVYFAEADAPLYGGAWQEGWHTGTADKLDYANDLGVHSTAFTSYAETNLVDAVVCELQAGEKISVYGLGWGVDGAHDIHRNSGGGGADGAIVLNAANANPHYLLFRFSNQSF